MRDADPNRDPMPADASRSEVPSSPTPAPARSASGQRMSSRLTALSSAAVLAVYTAGYLQTKSASDRFILEASTRRNAAPIEVGARYVPPAAVTPAAPSDTGVPAPEPSAVANPQPAPVANVATPAATSSATSAPAPVASASASAAPAPRAAAPAPPPPPGLLATTPASGDGLSAVASLAPAATLAAAPVYKDGTYSGWGTSRHGDIEATIVVAGGKITSAAISQCYTRWPCSWVSVLVPQVVARQSSEVDYVTGASHSTTAFYYAVVEALAKAK